MKAPGRKGCIWTTEIKRTKMVKESEQEEQRELEDEEGRAAVRVLLTALGGSTVQPWTQQLSSREPPQRTCALVVRFRAPRKGIGACLAWTVV